MSLDSRLSSVLHLLLHLMESQEAIPSGRLATALNSNPVVVRRTMAGLRDAGLVSSEKGHGGGWRLACDPARTTLLDVYRALGSPTLFAIGHRSQNPTCLIEQAVNVALDGTLREAEARITARLQTLTLAALASDFHSRRQLSLCAPQENPHAL
ncbi:DNA-binding IscR family transcriptional regulator [Deinococcus sp. HSC-46F16]|uniref:Rrf2 family transcriptional regulator n=1 Tax=Deinococcus sp. HSC-46F16 TaxID=2910968 RepID=UPI00209F1D15|nr:Rrf2 family transcriptional regulator [Deinococcus sp. HSC-46F16]MCP2014550.1 DNA-binding IscR family transcriptional regulator [Deinococcus sp. HSC-46F16]